MSLNDSYAKVYLLNKEEEEKFQEGIGIDKEKETEIIISKYRSRTSTFKNELSPNFEQVFTFCVSF